MGIDYQLTLAGDCSPEQLMELAAPATTSTPSLDDGGNLSLDLYQESGYLINIRSGTNGYFDAEDDGETHWEWEPSKYVNITFYMQKSEPSRGVSTMVATVAQVLADRPEDAALVLNGNWVLLTRTDGKLRMHHRSQWWVHHSLENLIPW
jgi:hypothetical protein